MASVPANKRVLNTHISPLEMDHLKRVAKLESMTVTMYLRNLIRADMGLAVAFRKRRAR